MVIFNTVIYILEIPNDFLTTTRKNEVKVWKHLNCLVFKKLIMGHFTLPGLLRPKNPPTIKLEITYIITLLGSCQLILTFSRNKINFYPFKFFKNTRPRLIYRIFNASKRLNWRFKIDSLGTYFLVCTFQYKIHKWIWISQT